MKKKIAILTIVFCVIASATILACDYYRAIFVSAEDEVVDYSPLITIDSTSVLEMEEKERYSLVIFGDNLIHESILREANRNAGGDGNAHDYPDGFDFLPIYEKVESVIREADFSICNQSSLVGANPNPQTLAGYPNFNTPIQLGEDLVTLGFDCVNIANNHMLDLSDEGYYRSLSYWSTKSIHLAGGFASKEERNNLSKMIVNLGEIRVGILAYTEGTNGIRPKSNTTEIPYYTFRESVILRDLIEAEVTSLSECVDFVITLVNWGYSSGYDRSAEQRDFAELLANAGADLIVGTGPKVIQGVERFEGRDSDGEVLCFYSLGNMMGTMNYMDNLLGGYLTFDLQKVDDTVRLLNPYFHPTVIHYDQNVENIKLYPLEDYTMELFLKHGSNLKFGFGNFSWFQETLYQYIPKEFLK